MSIVSITPLYDLPLHFGILETSYILLIRSELLMSTKIVESVGKKHRNLKVSKKYSRVFDIQEDTPGLLWWRSG